MNAHAALIMELSERRTKALARVLRAAGNEPGLTVVLHNHGCGLWGPGRKKGARCSCTPARLVLGASA